MTMRIWTPISSQVTATLFSRLPTHLSWMWVSRFMKTILLQPLICIARRGLTMDPQLGQLRVSLSSYLSVSTLLTSLQSSGNVYPSTSFYVQQLFSLNRGDEYLPSTLPNPAGTLFWGVVRKTSVTPNEIIIKVNITSLCLSWDLFLISLYY